MDFFSQKHKGLYKVHDAAPDVRRKQAERREQLLREQRQHREDAVDDARGLVHHIQTYSLPNYWSNRLPYKTDLYYRNKLQLSEWMRDRPEQLEQWVVVPCPKGKRHIVVASNTKTIAYSKSGQIVDIFQSSLQSHRYLTVLDCIYSKQTQEFYVLDCLAYHNREFLLCEAEFRFYFTKSKFEEYDHRSAAKGNEYSFNYIERADFERPEEVERLFNRYPMWEGNKPQLDGFLLYHKLASYTHGSTPLVGWLYPYMVPEQLGYDVHPKYMEQKPENYTNCLEFMAAFDEKRTKKDQKHQDYLSKKILSEGDQRKPVKMDTCDEAELTDPTEQSVELDELELATALEEPNGDGPEQEAEATANGEPKKRISIFKF